MIRLLTGTCAALLAATAANGQGTAEWLWSVQTDDGDALVEPGEVAVVSLAIEMTPDPGLPPLCDLCGLAAITFNTLGGANADRGEIVDWEPNEILVALTGDTTTTDGVSLFGTELGQLFQIFSPDNPIAALDFAWETSDFSGYEVAYTTETIDPFDTVVVFQDVDGDGVGEPVEWPISEAEIAFTVVPSPASLAVLGAAMLMIRRRSRAEVSAA